MLSTILYSVIVSSLVTQGPEINQETEKAKAIAALKLAEASAVRAEKKDACCENVQEGRKKSLETGKPLILWVGMDCKDIPKLREELKDCVHAHAKEYKGNDEPGIVVPTANGDYHFAKEKILKGTLTAKDILDILGKKTSKIELPVFQEFCPTNT